MRRVRLTRNPGFPSFPSKPSIPGGPFRGAEITSAHTCVGTGQTWITRTGLLVPSVLVTPASPVLRLVPESLERRHCPLKTANFITKAHEEITFNLICTHFFTFEAWRTVSSSLPCNTGLTLKPRVQTHWSHH